MLNSVLGYVTSQDAQTRAFVARVLTLGVVGTVVMDLAAIIALAAFGRAIPPVLITILAFLLGGQVFGQGAHSTSPPTLTDGTTTPTAPTTPPAPLRRRIPGD